MTLIYDDIMEVYIWVDVGNYNNELSPQFDDQESAVEWYGIISAHILSEYGITGDTK